MDKAERLTEALRTLRALKFSPLPKRGGVRRFTGSLFLNKGPVKVELLLGDLEFTEYPTISLAERPTFLPAMMPHVDVLGHLCYFASGTIVLDRFNPGGAIALCVQQATDVLNKIVADPTGAFDEAQDEFLAYWSIGQAPIAETVFIGDVDSRIQDAIYFRLGEKNNVPLRMVSQNPAEVSSVATSLRGGQFDPLASSCWVFASSNKPFVPANGLPKNIGQLFAWLKQWDVDLYKQLNVRFERDQKYLGGKSTVIVIKTAYGWLGALVRHDSVHRQSLRRRPDSYKQYLHNKGKDTKIIRLSLDEIGTSFIHSRNLVHEDLCDKRITVVGCGSIGGYLAQGLLRLGAGTGARGKLTLIDNESLRSENLGRHYLGLPDLGRMKADALRDELLRQFPFAKIEANSTAVIPSAAFLQGNLIVNATGEEAVSEMLNEYHIHRLQKAPRNTAPMLHVWIKGAGDCVQALWVDSVEHGCFRCLKIPGAPPDSSERHRVLKDETPVKFVGCKAITPYSVSAPMSAAALALDMTAAWLQGEISPRFRTRTVETANVYKVPNKDLEPIKGCPACSNQS